MHRVYPKYRIKPTIIEAVKIGKDLESWVECLEFIGIDEEYICQAAMDMIGTDGGIEVPVEGGHVLAPFGYYILRGTNGNYSVSNASDFEKICERIEETPKKFGDIKEGFNVNQA